MNEYPTTRGNFKCQKYMSKLFFVVGRKIKGFFENLYKFNEEENVRYLTDSKRNCHCIVCRKHAVGTRILIVSYIDGK